MRYLLLGFSECVFRRRPSEVRDMIKAPPFSEAENKIIDDLSDDLGQCVPLKQGEKVPFSRVQLRALLGEAAYDVDLALASPEAASGR